MTELKENFDKAVESDSQTGSVDKVIDFYLENKDFNNWNGGFQMLNAMYGYDDINERMNQTTKPKDYGR